MEFLVNILEQGFLFGIVAIGVYITYKILDFPDLSVDGTYPMGASIAAVLLVNGVNPVLATFCSFLGGAVAGFCTAFLHVKLKISNLMSGILIMIGLYSVNLYIMGKSNISLLNINSIFSGKYSNLLIISIVIILVKIIIDLFVKTKLGLLLFAIGDNEQIVTSLGVNKGIVKFIALMLSNGLVALSGGLVAQYNGYADVGLGNGIVVKGLACVIIGYSIFSKIRIIKNTTKAILGTIIYYSAISIALRLNFDPNLLNLLTSLVIIVALAIQNGVINIKRIKPFRTGVDTDVTNKEPL